MPLVFVGDIQTVVETPRGTLKSCVWATDERDGKSLG